MMSQVIGTRSNLDRINGDTEWMAGEILFQSLDLSEKESIEGYLPINEVR